MKFIALTYTSHYHLEKLYVYKWCWLNYNENIHKYVWNVLCSGEYFNTLTEAFQKACKLSDQFHIPVIKGLYKGGFLTLSQIQTIESYKINYKEKTI